MHGPINVKSPNNTSKWQMGFNSAFKGLKSILLDLQHFLDHNVVLESCGPVLESRIKIQIKLAVFVSKET